ncbi:MAG: helix-turn-helix transcriptional regulator [Elusimicrobia bacterium]|nr:helix-turn-helix transcriptional regulator [Elusimicrobiota bacterium]
MRKSIYSPKHKLIIERLRRARLDAGFRQIDVAKKLRTPQSYISRCESGDHRLDVVELETFAKLYGKPLSFFIA